MTDLGTQHDQTEEGRSMAAGRVRTEGSGGAHQKLDGTQDNSPPGRPLHLHSRRDLGEPRRASAVPTPGEWGGRNERLDLYAILNVRPDATAEEIASAYRGLAAHYYAQGPRRAEDRERLRLLNVAYEVLRDPIRRLDYDQGRLLGEEVHRPRPAPTITDITVARSTRPDHHFVAIRRRTGGIFEALGVLLVVAVALYAAYLATTVIDLPRVSSNMLEMLTGMPKQRLVGAPPATAQADGLSPATANTEEDDKAARLAQEFAGSRIDISNTSPAQYTDITLTLTLMRNGEPVQGVPVVAIIHYRTVVERHPRDGQPVKTNRDGVASIKVNIGPASAAYPARVDMVATYEDYQLVWQTSFTPVPPPTRVPGAASAPSQPTPEPAPEEPQEEPT